MADTGEIRRLISLSTTLPEHLLPSQLSWSQTIGPYIIYSDSSYAYESLNGDLTAPIRLTKDKLMTWEIVGISSASTILEW